MHRFSSSMSSGKFATGAVPEQTSNTPWVKLRLRTIGVGIAVRRIAAAAGFDVPAWGLKRLIAKVGKRSGSLSSGFWVSAGAKRAAALDQLKTFGVIDAADSFCQDPPFDRCCQCKVATHHAELCHLSVMPRTESRHKFFSIQIRASAI
ncbi:hypothetical protein V8201_17720 [Sphingomonas kyungheensis]|uniref:Uncharacterized protein n=1 Tax=Sphingomonas kyungheensis TaxID=1069987 RepID=A0ABU8H796_9SPHN